MEPMLPVGPSTKVQTDKGYSFVVAIPIDCQHMIALRLGESAPLIFISRAIALFQIFGASALAAFLLGEMHQQTVMWPTFIIIATLLIVTGISFTSGIWLWNGEKRGYGWSILVQTLQAPVVASTLIVYKIVFGFAVTVYVSSFPPHIGFDIGGQGFLVFLSASAPFQLGINVVAVCAASYLLWRFRVIKKSLSTESQYAEKTKSMRIVR